MRFFAFDSAARPMSCSNFTIINKSNYVFKILWQLYKCNCSSIVPQELHGRALFIEQVTSIREYKE